MIKMAIRCIICGKQRDGLEVKTDWVITSMRWFKRNVTKDEQGNRLVVCKGCYPIYKKNRDKYTSRQTLYLVLGALFIILGLLISSYDILRFLSAIGLSVIILAVLYLISLLNYTPALAMPQGKKGASNTKQ